MEKHTNLVVHKFPLGELSTNCYIIEHTKMGEVWIIDPADASDFISQKCLDLNAKVSKIIATHGHFDHILAAHELTLIFNQPLLIHPRDQFLLTRMHETAEHFLGHKVEQREPTMVDTLSMRAFDWSGEQVLFIETPGHTPGSISLYFSSIGALFTGDTLFASGSVGRTDFSYSNRNDIKKSLQTLLHFSPETVIYSGHGELSTVKAEKSFHL